MKAVDGSAHGSVEFADFERGDDFKRFLKPRRWKADKRRKTKVRRKLA